MRLRDSVFRAVERNDIPFNFELKAYKLPGIASLDVSRGEEFLLEGTE